MHMRGIIATSDFKIEIAYIRSLDPSDIFQFSVATTEMKREPLSVLSFQDIRVVSGGKSLFILCLSTSEGVSA